MNAGTAFITNLAPEYVRTSFSMWHSGYAMGEAAAKTLQGEDRGRRLHRLPARQGQPRRVQARLRGQWRQGHRRHPDGRRRRRARFHAVLPARQGQEAGCVLRVRAGRRSCRARSAKTYGALGMREAGIKLIGPGDITQDIKLQAHGSTPRSASSPCTTTTPISTIRRTSASSPPGRRITAPTRRRTSWRSAATTAWPPSCMRASHQGQDGRGRGGGARSRAGSSTARSGPIMIDPETRDIVMNEYLSEVVMGRTASSIRRRSARSIT